MATGQRVRLVAVRIVLTVPSLAREFGGPVTKINELSAGLRARGHHAEVIGCGVGRAATGLPVLARYHSNQVPRTLTPLRAAITRADVVHVMGLREPVSVAAALTARRSRVPYVIEPVGTHRRRVRSHRLKRAFDATTGKAILRDARAIIATSRMEAAELVEDGIPPSSIRIRSNGVCFDAVLPLPRPGDLRAALGIPSEAPLVLFLGRIAAKKKLLHLVHALDRLPGVWALIAGPDYHDGTLQAIESLRRRLDLEDRLLVLPKGLWDEQKSQALADADCFCLPSESENFGTAALEAAGAGLPVVLSDCCGGAELLGPQASVVFDYGNIGGLAEALRTVIEDASAGAAARAAAPGLRESLDWATLAADQEGIYESVLRESKGAGMKF
ncbi:MAG TPA: glycosyltransferase [Thermoleophilia bacterium]|nr:glycosyltransferase [Thermoleophilia bacterium]